MDLLFYIISSKIKNFDKFNKDDESKNSCGLKNDIFTVDFAKLLDTESIKFVFKKLLNVLLETKRFLLEIKIVL